MVTDIEVIIENLFQKFEKCCTDCNVTATCMSYI